jgi:hypothetical protein
MVAAPARSFDERGAWQEFARTIDAVLTRPAIG